MHVVPVTVVEMPEFVRQSEGTVSEQERLALITFLSRHPKAGVIMPGTGGVRKLRMGLHGRGKSGGARVIYYYHNETIPIFLLSLFPKNIKGNLSQAEKNEMRRVVPVLVQRYQRGIGR
jgi:hypothetical protein